MYLLNPREEEAVFKEYANLHSTMYLLNPFAANADEWLTRIYIPLCIY